MIAAITNRTKKIREQPFQICKHKQKKIMEELDKKQLKLQEFYNLRLKCSLKLIKLNELIPKIKPT